MEDMIKYMILSILSIVDLKVTSWPTLMWAIWRVLGSLGKSEQELVSWKILCQRARNWRKRSEFIWFSSSFTQVYLLIVRPLSISTALRLHSCAKRNCTPHAICMQMQSNPLIMMIVINHELIRWALVISSSFQFYCLLDSQGSTLYILWALIDAILGCTSPCYRLVTCLGICNLNSQASMNPLVYLAQQPFACICNACYWLQNCCQVSKYHSCKARLRYTAWAFQRGSGGAQRGAEAHAEEGCQAWRTAQQFEQGRPHWIISGDAWKVCPPLEWAALSMFMACHFAKLKI